MKNIYLIIVFVVARFGYAQSQSYEINPINKKDTINLIDVTGKKQGLWIVFGKSKPNTCYAENPTSKVELGKYADNKKGGIWKEFHCNGNMKNKITFTNGRPDGYAVMYHENGKVSEEGTWKINKWVGNYKLYYDNGQVQQEFNYNPAGKREGQQKYFYENGQVMIEGSWVLGKEAGLKERIYCLGAVSHMADAYNAADFLVHPTLEDTYALVVLEAMAHGLPVVVSSAAYCGIAAELQDGVNALLLHNPKDITELTENCNKLITDVALYSKLSDQSQSFAKQCSWQQVVTEHVAIYTQLTR